MKKGYLILFLCCLSVLSFSQSLIPSTVREVFNFTVGDTFVYHMVLCPNCLPQYRHESYFYLAIQTKHNSGLNDTVFYDTNLGEKVFGSLDSSVLAHSLQPIPFFFVGQYCFYSLAAQDSIYHDTTCFIRKTNISGTNLSLSCGGSSKYADGLGLIEQRSSDSGYPSDPFLNWEVEMIYSSTQNGVCGSYPPSVFTTANSISKEDSWVHIFPNPAITSLTLQLSSPPTTKTHFILYDAFGRQVKREEIVSINTTIQRGDLPNGVYFWQLQQLGKRLGRGKVVVE